MTSIHDEGEPAKGLKSKQASVSHVYQEGKSSSAIGEMQAVQL